VITRELHNAEAVVRAAKGTTMSSDELVFLMMAANSIAEGFARHVTEMLWTAGARPGAKGPAWLFFPVLALFVVAGGLAMTRAAPLTLILVGANVAALNFAVLSFHTLRLNRALLPEPLRPPRWREAVVALGGLAFALLVGRVLVQLLLGL